MTKRKRKFNLKEISRAIFGSVVIIPTLISLTGKLIKLIGEETHIAIRSFINVIIVAIVVVILVTSTWGLLLALLGSYLISIGWSLTNILFLLIPINIVMLIVFLIILANLKKKLFFPDSTKVLSQAISVYKEL